MFKEGDIVVLKDNVIEERSMRGWSATDSKTILLRSMIGKPIRIEYYDNGLRYITHKQFNIPLTAICTIGEYRRKKIKSLYD